MDVPDGIGPLDYNAAQALQYAIGVALTGFERATRGRYRVEDISLDEQTARGPVHVTNVRSGSEDAGSEGRVPAKSATDTRV